MRRESPRGSNAFEQQGKIGRGVHWHWNHNSVSFSNAAGGSEITGHAAFYGATGWLGLARIVDYTQACEILQAESLMNQSYLDGSSYDETDARLC